MYTFNGLIWKVWRLFLSTWFWNCHLLDVSPNEWDGIFMDYISHYREFTWASWCLKSPATWLFVQQCGQANNKERKYQSSTLQSHCEGNLLYIGPVMQKKFPCDDVIMKSDLTHVVIEWDSRSSQFKFFLEYVIEMWEMCLWHIKWLIYMYIICIHIIYRWVQLWNFCLIEYVHFGAFDKPSNFGIPWLVIQIKSIIYIYIDQLCIQSFTINLSLVSYHMVSMKINSH